MLPIASLASKSATVRATFSTRWNARAESAICAAAWLRMRCACSSSCHWACSRTSVGPISAFRRVPVPAKRSCWIARTARTRSATTDDGSPRAPAASFS